MGLFPPPLFRHTSLTFRLILLGIGTVFIFTGFHIFHYTSQHQHLKASYIQQIVQKNIQNITLLIQMHLEKNDELLVLLRRLQLKNPEIFYIGLSQEGREYLHVSLENETFSSPPLHATHTLETLPPTTVRIIIDQDKINTQLTEPFLPLYEIFLLSGVSLLFFLGGVFFGTRSLRTFTQTLFEKTRKKDASLHYTPNEALLIERCFASLVRTNETQQTRLEMLNLHFEELIEAKTFSLKAEIKEKNESQKNLEISNQEKTILLKEVHHRVKNNLAVIAGLIRMQSRRIADSKTKSLFVDLQNRIKTMELIHTDLYTSKTFNKINMKHYLASLAQNLNKTFSEECESITFFVSCDELLLEIDQAITCGQLVNELVTNAFKHAFKEKEEGHIWVAMKEVEGMIELRIEDSGKSIQEGTPQSFSLGLSLVHELTKYQLKGKVKVQNEGGLRYTITFKK
ncbi:sensor histidine kinase [Sulfurospirillum sp. T05]|uniref:histidine kinase n=1 Tax=Sulfurospirillum tamanense TaxID=2813362 RepID=A0ABS2WPV5_9BACT|nr:sensor histidine kinase [Sulfurospirillum tamanensis]MBN2963732.1 sensor histidine kinase [Sulfurospirillum tamanensis]